ncbi:MAG TPA: dihydrolipoamide acetyltransferase family protein [Candidatus Dormibacteraeota bacterium]|nr:dihydrolipoamide acetyltransferase family protein [Candidatus Dormibacteraeota bacterium]
MGETTRVTMPQLGESVHEGTISRWLVKPGDRVEEFEPMLEVDTDKVNAEVPSPVTGVLREILANEGQTIEAGSEIAVVELEGGSAAASTTAAAPAAEAAAPPARAATATAPVAQAEANGAVDQEKGGRGEHRFSPAVLMAAEDARVDLSQVEGSGLGGRVTKRDVRQFVERRDRGASPQRGSRPDRAAAAPAAPAAPKVAAAAGDEVQPLTRIRRLIAENMTLSKTTIPHAWQTQEVDMSGVVANRAANKGAFQAREGFSLTYLPYVVAAAVSALRENPAANATFNGDEIIRHGAINLGISVGTEDTLVVPVIRGADGLSLAGLARSINDLATRARTKKLTVDDLSGGTFTVNNSGSLGTLFSYSVINPGQAGILTMEAIVERPVAVNGMIGIKPMMYLCFSFDHRVLDGLQGARFLVSSRKWLEAVTVDTPIY